MAVRALLDRSVCWLRPELFEALRPSKLYWLSALTAEDLAAPSLDLEAITPRRTGQPDIFGTANSFNYVPFTAALDLLLELGIDEVAACIDELVLRLHRRAGPPPAGRDRPRPLPADIPRGRPLAAGRLGAAAGSLHGGVRAARRSGRARGSPAPDAILTDLTPRAADPDNQADPAEPGADLAQPRQ
jgi:hypothetical protein